MKKALILFPEGNLPYSPTTLNLIRFLSDCFEVVVFAQKQPQDTELDAGLFSLVHLRPFSHRPPRSLLRRGIHKIVTKTGMHRSDGELTPEHQDIYMQILECINVSNPDIVIAVDLFALECCKRAGVRCVFLSLEIPGESPYYSSLSYEGIDAVIIQRQDRFDYLFGTAPKKPPMFILPNAPVYLPPSKRSVASKRLIYNGYIWSAFGPQFPLNLLSKYPEHELHLKGVISNEDMMGIYYPHLMRTPSVRIDSGYLPDNALRDYLSDFSIGFCFYHFEHPFIKANKFNYETGPSGKLFTYLTAGLPVLCSDIPAFTFVGEAGAGILVNDYSPDSLKSAIDTILSDYGTYSDNALQLASDHSFSKHIQPVLDYLKNYTGDIKYA